MLLSSVLKIAGKMIAGNIKYDNIPILDKTDYFIDLSGSLEDHRGKKDLKKIDYFLNSMKQYEN